MSKVFSGPVKVTFNGVELEAFDPTIVMERLDEHLLGLKAEPNPPLRAMTAKEWDFQIAKTIDNLNRRRT